MASRRLCIGDRVAGMVHGNNKLRPDVGAFAEYVGADADLLLKLPDTMGFEEAASFGVGVATAILCLFGELKIPVSIEQFSAVGDLSFQGSGDFVLVAGGSTASGTRALQLLKM